MDAWTIRHSGDERSAEGEAGSGGKVPAQRLHTIITHMTMNMTCYDSMDRFALCDRQPCALQHVSVSRKLAVSG